MEAALAMLDEVDPHLMFVNLGDIDRVGHSDLTGPLGLKAARRAALATPTRRSGRFVDALKSTGRWERSIVIVLADHSMDWSTPDKVVSLSARRWTPTRCSPARCRSPTTAAPTSSTGPARTRAARRGRPDARARRAPCPACWRRHDQTNPWLRLGPEAGDVVVFCEAGWRFSDPNPVTANPIPGNHGHPATRNIPFFIGGGSPAGPARRRRRPGTPAPSTSRRPWRRSSGWPPAGAADGRVRRALTGVLAASRASALRTTAGSVVVHIGGRLALRKRP